MNSEKKIELLLELADYRNDVQAWADAFSEDAEKLLLEFSLKDWRVLVDSVQSWHIESQRRLGAILGPLLDVPSARQITLSNLNSDDDGLLEAALYALDEREDIVRVHKSTVSTETLSRLKMWIERSRESDAECLVTAKKVLAFLS